MTAATGIAVAPLLPWIGLAALGLAILAVLAVALWRRARGTWWRAAALLALWLVLLNPTLVIEERDPRPDVAVIAVDESRSQRIGDRAARAATARDALVARLAALPDLEVRTITLHNGTGGAGGGDGEGTELLPPLRQALADVPEGRRAGVILLSDGQVHDVPADPAESGIGAPLHLLLTGAPGERDRRLVITNAPSYGLVDKEVTVGVTVEESGAPASEAEAPVALVVRVDGRERARLAAVPGRPVEIPIRLDHAGETVVEIDAAEAPGELTGLNNTAVLPINGVRERLRVLLVSGEPHPGERTWRTMLKSDPSVDLVHFTILRPPEKQDGTPIRELSLIAFPIRELFELKLAEFDLIIFDRYRRRGVLPHLYLRNIARYVQEGGALLEAVGPTFATPLSLFGSPLGEVLPGEPTGEVFEQGFRAHLSDPGRRHPVTADLPGAGAEVPDWGRWFRHVDAIPAKGTVVMEGVENRPLLLLDRVGEGRVAQLMSDHMWLWARGYEGGGPEMELLRRIAHWLMKEPELEENDLDARLIGEQLEIVRRSLEPSTAPVVVTTPDGVRLEVPLQEAGRGREVGRVAVSEHGLYRLDDGTLSTLAAVGQLNPVELAEVRASPAPLAPLIEATGGSVHWLDAAGTPPAVRRVSAGAEAAGRDWLGLRRNGAYTVTGVAALPLAPPLLAVFLVLGLVLLAWRQEGR